VLDSDAPARNGGIVEEISRGQTRTQAFWRVQYAAKATIKSVGIFAGDHVVKSAKKSGRIGGEAQFFRQPHSGYGIHIHQVHFFAYAENGIPLVHPMCLDTVNVPYRASIDVILDFIDRSSKGCPYSIVIC
jgi:hypothetical protein